MNRPIPFVYTSSEAALLLESDEYKIKPKGIYAEVKLEAEKIIKSSGINYAIFRLGSHWHCQVFTRKELQLMFSSPLEKKLETNHPINTATAIMNSIRNFDTVKGKTLIISGGSMSQILHRDQVNAIMKTWGLPLPPLKKFNQNPTNIAWYNTQESQALLNFQQFSFEDSMKDYEKELSKRFSPLFLFLMRKFIGPIFGKIIVRYI